MQLTIDEIVKASGLPLSIIIVGVGDADFDAMEQLDGDVTPLYSTAYNQYCHRDIVQFVPFRKFAKDPVRLAKEVLAEIPGQLTSYFASKRIKPLPKKMGDRAALVIRNQMKHKMAQMMGVNNTFAGNQRQHAILACQQMGFDLQQTAHFINNVCIAEENINWILTYMNDPNYRNVLK